MKNSTEIVNELVSWFEGEPGVLACFLYGSVTTKNHDRVSDIDFAVILSPGSADRFFESLVVFMEGGATDLFWKNHTASAMKMSIWLDAAKTKLDITYGYQSSDLFWLAEARDVPEPRLVCVFAPKIDVSYLIQKAEEKTYPNDEIVRGRIFKEEADKFVTAFEACSSAHARSDSYLFYFHYNLALGRLVRMVQLVHHNIRHLYAPRNIIAGTFPLDRQIEFRELSGTLYLPEVHDKKKRLADQFLRVIQEAESALGLIQGVKYESVLSGILERDQFHNFRDVFASLGIVQCAGRLFRSATLSRWAGTGEVPRLTASKMITDIVDLRSGEELSQQPYQSEDLEHVQYHHIQFVPPNFRSNQSEWLGFFKENEQNIALALDVLINAEGGVLIHCHIGRDRTGWLIALVLLGLGVSESEIIWDYKASLMDTDKDPVESLLPMIWDWLLTAEIIQERMVRLNQKYGI